MKTKIIVTLLLIYTYNVFVETYERNFPQEADTIFISSVPSNLISILNKTSNCSAIWDPSSHQTTLFNGKTGSTVTYNCRNNSGIYIPKINYQNNTKPQYSQNLTLQQPNPIINGTVFTKYNVTSNISDEISDILSNLTQQFETQTSNSLNALTNISNILSQLFDGPLHGFLQIIGNRVVPSSCDLFHLLEILDGISTFFNDLRGGINTLLDRKFEFDPSPLFNARNGIEALATLLSTLEGHFNLNEVLNGCLNSVENILQLVTKLGGNMCSGVNGLLRGMYEELCSGGRICNITLKDLEQDPDSYNEWADSVELLYNVTQNLGSEFGGLSKFVRNLKEK